MNVSDLGTILGIWAHPDDELWAAGAMAEAIKNGQRVVCVTATKGDAGKTANQQKWPQEKLSQIRVTEMSEALSAIGIHELHWLGYGDGKLINADSKKVVARIKDIIDAVRPDTIFTFEPEGVSGHDDHKTISAWSLMAAKESAVRPVIYGACETTERYEKFGRSCDDLFDIYFNTDNPFTVDEKHADLLLKLNRAQAKQKMHALRSHASQMSAFFNNPAGKNYWKKFCDVECFIRLA
jgi:LmbE family N-acetylglucosaminyl deacetylase